jgi:lactoylglutathione lyase
MLLIPGLPRLLLIILPSIILPLSLLGNRLDQQPQQSPQQAYRRTIAMKLNHLNLTVTDVAETRDFLAKYFGLQDGGGNKSMGFMTDENGLLLTLTSMKVGKETSVKYPATFHVGFIQESKERVNEINERLKQDGYDVPPPSKQHGSWTFYFAAPGGFTIEVLC